MQYQTNNSENIQFIQSGANAVQRTSQNKMRDIVSVKDFGAVGDNIVDDTEAIQSAINACISGGVGYRSLYIPGGNYKVTETLLVEADDFLIYGDGLSSALVSHINNGTSCLKIANGLSNWNVSNILILGNGLNTNTFNDGSSNPINSIGFEAYQVTSNFITRYSINNLHIKGFQTGAKIGGFIAQIENLFITYCALGLQGSILNSVKAVLRFENCRKSYEITNSYGLHLDNLLDEGVCSLSTSSTIDNCNGVKFTAPYFEWDTNPRSEPYLTIGGSQLCQNISIENGNCVVSSGFNFNVYPIKLDNVNGATIDIYFSSGTRDVTIQTTANTKNLFIMGGQSASNQWMQDQSLQLGAAYNYFPNSNFDLWFRGWKSVAPTRATLSKENTIVRKGLNAVKISANAGSSFNYVPFILGGPSVLAMRGKLFKIGAWVYVPDIAAYDQQNPTALPGVVLQSYNGTSFVSSPTANSGTKSGAWNFIIAEVLVQVDAAEIYINVYANQSGTNANGTEFVVLDSVILCEGTTPYYRMLNNDLIDSPCIDSQGIAGKCVIRGSAAPTDADQIYEAGDQILYTTPVAGAAPGLVCTTGGAGGTAVWKAMANLAP